MITNIDDCKPIEASFKRVNEDPVYDLLDRYSDILDKILA
jgi:hypothetical protein